MAIILFEIDNKYVWKTWKKSGKIMEFQNENLVATLITALMKKNIIASFLKFAVYINNHKMLSGNIFGLILRNKMAATGVFCQS